MLFWVPLVVFRKSSKWNNTLNQKKKKLKEREIEIDLILYYSIFHLFLILSINTTHITVAKTSSGIFNSLSLFPFSIYICGDELPKKVLSALEVLSHIGELSLPPLTYKRWAYVGVYQSCVVLSRSNKRQAMHDCTPLLLQVRGGKVPV